MAASGAFTLPRLFLVLAGIPAGMIVYWTWSAPVIDRYEQCATWHEWSSAMMNVADRAIEEDPGPAIGCDDELGEDDGRTESVGCLLEHYKSALSDERRRAATGDLAEPITELQLAAAAFFFATESSGESARRNGDRDRHLRDAVEYLHSSIARFEAACAREAR